MLGIGNRHVSWQEEGMDVGNHIGFAKGLAVVEDDVESVSLDWVAVELYAFRHCEAILRRRNIL